VDEDDGVKDIPIFLLYSGSSEDGRGTPRYSGRTEDARAAHKHWLECERNPYSIGKVVRVTDSTETFMMAADWSKLRIE